VNKSIARIVDLDRKNWRRIDLESLRKLQNAGIVIIKEFISI